MPGEQLGKAAAARHDRAVARAEEALRALDHKGAEISFQAVARRAGVSRQWLYTQPALREEILRLRERGPARSDGVPARQRASEASLRQRVESLRAENHRLRDENASLKHELAIAYGPITRRQRRGLTYAANAGAVALLRAASTSRARSSIAVAKRGHSFQRRLRPRAAHPDTF